MDRVGERVGGRAPRKDRKTHVNPALDAHTHDKLRRLALACDVTKTTLAGECIALVLNSPNMINYLQDRHGAGQWRVIPMTHNGRVDF